MDIVEIKPHDETTGIGPEHFFRIDFRGMYPRGNYLILSLIMESEYKLLLYEPFEVTFRINSAKMNTSDVINLMYDGICVFDSKI